MCNEAVARSPCMLGHVSDNVKTEEMCDTAMRMDPGTIMVLDGVLLRWHHDMMAMIIVMIMMGH